jgi:hypothetical protein
MVLRPLDPVSRDVDKRRQRLVELRWLYTEVYFAVL